MSAYFIITFMGHPLRQVSPGVMDVCAEGEATMFTSEAEAWLAARRQGLNPRWVNVRSPHMEAENLA